ncbi:hypothetical protein [Pengzhenrongella sicca]|uniref:Uncharacterized protein n=1 Tax=Pengzhenrongella sicca TaxID=2819238 RepID=A0A8A4Z978_9MICO|nr:hypothetical protein [Pengzhenrongella sicca]QTE28414.1 hypothetical protein J4E96_13635 [Pengzhenrongella sicca]
MLRQNLPPDYMPVLSRGRHRKPARGACFMEFASFLAGEKWSDHPACTHPLLATLARNVNDQMSDEGRQRLLQLVPSVVGLTSTDPEVDIRLAMLCAMQALPYVAADTQRVLAVGILSAERQLALREGRGPSDLTPAGAAALASAPHATSWARSFSFGIEPSSGAFHDSGAPSIVCCAILGLAAAAVPDRDELLRQLLTSGIALVESMSTVDAASAAPTAPAVPSDDVAAPRRRFASA